MTSLPGFPLGTLYNITNITQSNPGIVTLASIADAHSFAVANGQTITISNVKGMYQVNDERYVIGNFDAGSQTFQLFSIKGFPVNTINFSPYVSGGQINIISYPSTPGQPPGLMYNNQ